MAQLNGGSQNITSSGVVGVSGKPLTVYSYTFLSGATSGVVTLKDTNSSGAERHQATGTINKGFTLTFGPNGKFFPSGCYVVVDANTTYVDVDYSMQA